MRVLWLDAPIFILLAALGLVTLLRREPRPALPRRRPAEPFAPWP